MRPIQMKMARAGLGAPVREVAEKTGVSEFTIKRVEKGSDALASTLDALRGFYEGRGIVFTEGDGTLSVTLPKPSDASQ